MGFFPKLTWASLQVCIILSPKEWPGVLPLVVSMELVCVCERMCALALEQESRMGNEGRPGRATSCHGLIQE